MTAVQPVPDATLWQMIAETARSLAGTGTEHDIAAMLAAWTEPSERITVALGALRALSADETELVCEAALATVRGGAPGAPFDSMMAEASAWADMASGAELRAYAWAAFHSLPAGSRQRFLAKVCADDAPLEDRQAHFVRLWESFDNAARLAFVGRVDPNGEFRRRG